MLFNQDLYNDLIGYLGIEPGNGLPDTDNRVLMAMNAGLQKIWTKGPGFLRRQRGGCVLPSPTTISFSVTQGSTTIANVVGWLPNMIGCTVRIQGEATDNEFVDGLTLLIPITQANGTVTATVYFNAYTLPPGVLGVRGNCFLDDTAWELQPYPYEDQQMFKQWPSFPVDPYYILQSSLYIRLKVGVPTGYYVVPLQKQTGPYYQVQIKVWPLPASAHTVTYLQEMGPPKLLLSALEIGAVVTVATSTTATSTTATVTCAAGLSQAGAVTGPGIPSGTTYTISGTVLTLSQAATATATGVPLTFTPSAPFVPTLVTPIPGDMHETAWLPLSRMALSSYPHFLESKREYVQQEAADALEYLESLTPQRQAGSQLRPQTFMAN